MPSQFLYQKQTLLTYMKMGLGHQILWNEIKVFLMEVLRRGNEVGL